MLLYSARMLFNTLMIRGWKGSGLWTVILRHIMKDAL